MEIKKVTQFLLANLLVSAFYAQTVNYEALFSEEQLETRELKQELVVGKSPSSHAVSPTGAFNYNIPIQLPKGTNNLKPEISINYSSQGGNGLVGYGWNISGLSVISRVNQTIFHENKIKNVSLTQSDPLAWDGNRLVVQDGTYNTNGSTYSTESETFAKITGNNRLGSGVEYFTVETKEGKIMEFGKTTDSRVYSHNNQDIIVWKINKISDLNGNYITFNYVEIGDDHLISSIQYTGNTAESISPYISIDFEYVERNDANTIYATEYGKEITSKHLLDNINIIYLPTSTSFKKYEFKYGENFYSYLNEVIEYGKDDSQNHYNTLRFSYHDAGHDYSEITTGILPDGYEMYPGDFNGDGLTDILRAKRHINGNNELEYKSYQTILNSPNGYLSPQTISLPTGVITSQSMNSPILRETGIVFFDVSDYDGDGKDDIAIAVSIKDSNPLSFKLKLSHILIYYSNSSTGIQFNSPSTLYVSPSSSNYIGRQNVIIKGDFNGDGAMDLYCNVQDGFKSDYTHIHNQYYPQIFYPRISNTSYLVNNNGDNFSYNKLSYLDKAYVLDINGNGKSEIMQIYEHSDVNRTVVREFQFGNNLVPLHLYDDSHGTNNLGNYPNKNHTINIGDFNGDGKSDLLTSYDQISWDIHLSKGRSFNYTQNLTIQADEFEESIIIADFNGDNLSDIMSLIVPPNTSTTSIKLLYSKGLNSNSIISFEVESEVFSERVYTKPYGTNSWRANCFALIDYDGDGVTEILASSSIYDPLKVGNFSKDNRFGLISNISTGFNELTKVTHASIASNQNTTCRGLYTAENNATYPIIDFHKPFFVTSTVNTPDGSGMNMINNNRIKYRYYYQGGKLHKEGRGFLGFRKFEVEEEYTNGNELVPIHLSHEEYEIDQDFYFNRLKKSHQSIVNYAGHPLGQGQTPCFSLREIEYNLYSKENEYTTYPLQSNSRFFNRLDNTVEGYNIEGYTVNTSYDYTHLNASEHGNPTKITTERGDLQNGKVKTVQKFTYDVFGTHIPSSVTEQITTKRRNNYPEYKEVYEYDYDSKNRLIEKKRMDTIGSGAGKLTQSYTYNNFGLISTSTESIHNRGGIGLINKTYIYDTRGRFLIEELLPLNYHIIKQYDEESGLITHYTSNMPSDYESYTYDEFHRKTGETDQFNNTTSINREWDIKHSTSDYESEVTLYIITETTPGFGSQKTWYDHIGTVRKTEKDGFSNKIYQVYNYTNRGNLSYITDPFFTQNVENRYIYQYDQFGRRLKENYKSKNSNPITHKLYTPASHSGINTPYTYTNRTYSTAITRGDGQSKYNTIDATGKRVQSTDNGGIVSYNYHSNGAVNETMVNSLLVSRTFYDEFGHQNSLIEVNSGVTTYTHNILGELTRQEDAKGNFIREIQYDAFGRMTAKEVGKNGNTNRIYTYTYNSAANTNGFGQLIKEEVSGTGVDYTNDYTYTSNGQLSTISEYTPNSNLPVFTTGYSYYSNGQLSHEVFYQAGQSQVAIQYGYTNNGHLLEVTDASSTLEHSPYYFLGISQNPFGQWTEYQTLGHTTTNKTYTKSGLLTNEENEGLRIRGYSFNPHNGNLTNRDDLMRNLEESFNYDNLDRLTDIYIGEDNNTTTTYNANGNIEEFNELGDYSYHPTKKHAVTHITNPEGVISNGLQTITYDELNNPSTIEMNEKEWDYYYGPNHERRSVNMKDNTQGSQHWRQRLYTTNAEYIFDGNVLQKQIMYISGGDGLCGILVYDANTDETNNYAVFTDYLGSIEVITDELGQDVIFEQSFGAWGKYRDPDTWEPLNMLSGQTGDELVPPDWLWRGYTGHEMLNDFELIHMNGRLYDPHVARMLSPDNVVQDATSTQNYNRYSYVMNNPLKYTDPDGEFIVWSIHRGGFSIGVNFTPIGIGGGGGLNFGWGNGVSAGIYGEVGYRVGGTGFGAGATVTQSIDYNFKQQTTTTMTSAGVYAYYGPFNAGGNIATTYDLTNKEHVGYSWGVSAGVGIGNEKSGVGMFVGYGSSGWNYGLGGYYDPTVEFTDNQVLLKANDDGTYTESTGNDDFLDGNSINNERYKTNLRDNPNVKETINSNGTYTYTIDIPNRHRVYEVKRESGILMGKFNTRNGQTSFSTLNRANHAYLLSQTPYPGNRFNFSNFNYKYSKKHGRQPNHLNLFNRLWFR